MSFQWTLVASFLYVEVVFIILLLLPLISPPRWQKIFRSRLVTAISSYAGLYFTVILMILGLLFADAIREIIKYKPNTAPKDTSVHFTNMELVKELRAQRNFHISGTALFLWFVIKRLLALISHTAHLMAETEAAKKQAESASRAATSLLKDSKLTPDTKNNEKSDKTGSDAKLKEKEQELKELIDELNKAKLDVETMKKQSENISREYDNLLKEHAKLQAKLEKFENSGESKKSQ